MPGRKMTSKSGNAQIKRQGHTTDGRHGSSPDKRAKGGKVRDLKAK